MTEPDLREKRGIKCNDCCKKGWDEKEGAITYRVVSKQVLKKVKEEYVASISKESTYKVGLKESVV